MDFNNIGKDIMGAFGKKKPFIEDITIINGGKNENEPAPDGYERLDVNLNMGTSGSCIYACVKRGEDEAAAITGLEVISGNYAGISAPAGYEKINIDLNAKAGGKYIYLCKCRGNGKAIKDVLVVYGDSKDVGVMPGYEKINKDLNEGSGGKYIYFSYSR